MAACINFSSLADRILIYPIILLCTGTHVHLIHSLLIIMNEHKLLLAIPVCGIQKVDHNEEHAEEKAETQLLLLYSAYM